MNIREAMELAMKLAKQPPLSLRMIKQGMRRGMGVDLREYFEWHAAGIRLLMETEDHKEGARSFVEKREPVFKGM